MSYKVVQNNLIPSNSVHALPNLQMINDCPFHRHLTFSSIQTVRMLTATFFLSASCHLHETTVITERKDGCLK